MAERRYHSRRQWHNLKLVLYTAPFLLLGAFLFGLLTGKFVGTGIIVGLFAAVLILALLRDASTRATYAISGTELILSKGRDTLRLPGAALVDASLLDRQSARDYFLNKVKPQHAGRTAARRAFLRFCTVDIGLQTYTFGLGRGLIDRMPDARQDLVLLRLHDHKDLLLSPQFNHELVENVLRLQRRSAGAE